MFRSFLRRLSCLHIWTKYAPLDGGLMQADDWRTGSNWYACAKGCGKRRDFGWGNVPINPP